MNVSYYRNYFCFLVFFSFLLLTLFGPELFTFCYEYASNDFETYYL